MARAVVALAIRSGIPVSAWLDEPPQVLETALDLIAEANEKGGR